MRARLRGDTADDETQLSVNIEQPQVWFHMCLNYSFLIQLNVSDEAT